MSDAQTPVVIDQPTEHDEPEYGLSALLGQAKHLDAKLRRYSENRAKVLGWLRRALVDGIDYGKIRLCKPGHKRDWLNCAHRNKCENEFHWSKKSLWKPGAEKIIGMMSLIPTWPNADLYVERAAAGHKVQQVVLRCVLVNAKGRLVGEGVGGRDVSPFDDVNKALKMAKKSSLVDAVLSTFGLSEIFTQDIEDMRAPETGDMLDQADLVPIGPFAGKRWSNVTDTDLQWMLDEFDDETLRDKIKDVRAAREAGGSGDVAEEVATDEAPAQASLQECYQKIRAALTVEELERVWASVPEKYRPSQKANYEAQKKELSE